MADFTLDDLNAITAVAEADLLHVRNTAGFDKKITYANLKKFTGPVEFVRDDQTTWGYVDYFSFDVTADGWYTILRTEEKVAGKILLTTRGDDSQSLTEFSYDRTEDVGINGVLFDRHEPLLGEVEFESIRWGDGGAGTGLCLQVYINLQTSTTVTVKVKLMVDDDLLAAGAHSDIGSPALQSDADGNAVSVFETWRSMALPGLVKYKDIDWKTAKVFSGFGSITPGLYRSITVTGGDLIPSRGKYVVLGDVTVDSGRTIACPFFEWVNSVLDPILPWIPDQLTGGPGWWGGGQAGDGWSGSSGQYEGGGGPCAMPRLSAPGIKATAVWGGGYLQMDILGKLINNGTITATGHIGLSNNTQNWGGGGGGCILLRIASAGSTYGTIHCTGGAGISDGGSAKEGGGGGGGILEVYSPETTGGTLSCPGGAGTPPATASQPGTVTRVNIVTKPEFYAYGGTDEVAGSRYINAGHILRYNAGWDL